MILTKTQFNVSGLQNHGLLNYAFALNNGQPGIEPGTFCTKGKRSTTELLPF